MLGKDLHFHTGTLNYYSASLLLFAALPPSLSKLLTVGSLAIFLVIDILKTGVTTVNRPPLYDGGERHICRKTTRACPH